VLRDHPLRGRHILVVEDDFFQAFDLCAELDRCGASPVGPIASLDEAFVQLSSETPIDAALVDLNLGGEMVFPFADELVRRDIPLAFVTGYNQSVVPYRLQHIRRCEKPACSSELTHVAAELIKPSEDGQYRPLD
jgi:CheY-like chemotaxis protein